MTALPLPRLLTIAEYAELGETESGYTELQEGRLLLTPNQSPDHQCALLSLAVFLSPQLPRALALVHAVDVDLQLAPPHAPGSSRRPDLVVFRRAALERVRQDGGLLRASDVVVAVEIVSPGSRRTDHVLKRLEYADAGIPHYWIVDLDDPVSLVACHLAGDLGYQDGGAVAGTFTADEPFPVRVDLDALR